MGFTGEAGRPKQRREKESGGEKRPPKNKTNRDMVLICYMWSTYPVNSYASE